MLYELYRQGYNNWEEIAREEWPEFSLHTDQTDGTSLYVSTSIQMPVNVFSHH